MSLGIVIPLKSKHVATSWATTCSALESTLLSIRNQSNNDYELIIVGHDYPDVLDKYVNEKIKFHSVDFPVPPNRESKEYDVQLLIDDKLLKIITGLKLLGEEFDYYYQLDSDDLIDKDFVQTVLSNNDADGLVFKGGYLYYKKQGRIINCNNLDDWCGSILVAKKGSFPVPTKVDIELKYDLPWTKYRHQNMHLYFSRDHGQSVKFIDKPYIAYVLSSGDNFSDRWRNTWLKRIKWGLKPFIFGKRIGRDFKNRFGLL